MVDLETITTQLLVISLSTIKVNQIHRICLEVINNSNRRLALGHLIIIKRAHIKNCKSGRATQTLSSQKLSFTHESSTGYQEIFNSNNPVENKRYLGPHCFFYKTLPKVSSGVLSNNKLTRWRATKFVSSLS